MSTPLPNALNRYLLQTETRSRHAAWVGVDGAGTVTIVGGKLGVFGLSHLAIGQRAAEGFDILEGLLAPPVRSAVLPLVAMSTGKVADLHIVPDGATHWVLLLDATAEAHHQGLLQQQRYDALLGLARALRGGVLGVARALGLLILERRDEGDFFVEGTLPEWAVGLLPEKGDVDPAHVFPFLGSFLPDAELSWARGDSSLLRSGPWTETAPDGRELRLDAAAISLHRGAQILLIDPQGEAFHEKQELIQRAREQHLVHERALREMEKKDVLLHCIVHDLKGPLTGILGTLRLLHGGKLDAAQSLALVEAGLRSADRQKALIDDLLAAYSAEVAPVPDGGVDLATVVEECADSFGPAFRREGQDFRVRVPAGSHVARGSRSHLQRVLGNLLENSLRHTPRGGSVAVSLTATENVILTEVDNDGPSVQEELRPQLFEKFRQGGKRSGSSGLGLFFCKLTVERFGGSIGYRSRNGGSVFWFSLPRGDAAACAS